MTTEQENRKFLASYDPDLLMELEHDPEVVVEPARREGLTMRIGKKQVHSKYNPIKEAQQIIEKDEMGPQKLHVHFGFGLGYFLDADQSQENGVFLIFEPNPALISAALAAVSFRERYRDRKVALCCDPKRFKSLVIKHLDNESQVRVIISPFHQKEYREELKNFVEVITRERNKKGITSGSAKNIFRYFLEMTLRSMRYSMCLPGIDRLEHQFKGKPAVIVVAGPSLERNIKELRAYQDKVIIICISRAIRSLEAEGIVPHFMVHTDAKDYFSVIEGLSSLGDVNFLLAEQAHTRFYQAPSKRSFVFHNPGNQVSRFTNDFFPQTRKKYVVSGGSVATDAISIARILGCNPITLMGQDLAMTQGRFYSPSATNVPFIANKHEFRNVRGSFGGTLVTTANYLHFINWFEEVAEHWAEIDPNLKLYNATEGGALIRGFEPIKFRDVAKRHFIEVINLEPILENAANVTEKKSLPVPQQQAFFRKALKIIENQNNTYKEFQQYLKRFEPFLSKLDEGQLEKLQHKLKEFNKFNLQMSQTLKELPFLSGFTEEEVMGNQKRDMQNFEQIIQGIQEDLKVSKHNFKQLEIACIRLGRILSELV